MIGVVGFQHPESRGGQGGLPGGSWVWVLEGGRAWSEFPFDLLTRATGTGGLVGSGPGALRFLRSLPDFPTSLGAGLHRVCCFGV